MKKNNSHQAEIIKQIDVNTLDTKTMKLIPQTGKINAKCLAF